MEQWTFAFLTKLWKIKQWPAFSLQTLIFKQNLLISSLVPKVWARSDPLETVGCTPQCFLTLIEKERWASHYFPWTSWHFPLCLHQFYPHLIPKIGPPPSSLELEMRFPLHQSDPLLEPRSISQTGTLEERFSRNIILIYYVSTQSPPQLFKALYIYNLTYFSEL